jgi:hypothetical protein
VPRINERSLLKVCNKCAREIKSTRTYGIQRIETAHASVKVCDKLSTDIEVFNGSIVYFYLCIVVLIVAISTTSLYFKK